MPSDGASVVQSLVRNVSSNDEKVHTVAAVIVAVLLDAITTRPGTASVAMVMNQRPDRRSKRMRPPNGVPLPFTLAKKVVVLAFSTPSPVPALTKLRMKPLAIAMNCVGPAAALPSGGSVEVSEKRMAVKDAPDGSVRLLVRAEATSASSRAMIAAVDSDTAARAGIRSPATPVGC